MTNKILYTNNILKLNSLIYINTKLEPLFSVYCHYRTFFFLTYSHSVPLAFIFISYCYTSIDSLVFYGYIYPRLTFTIHQAETSWTKSSEPYILEYGWIQMWNVLGLHQETIGDLLIWFIRLSSFSSLSGMGIKGSIFH